MSKRPIKDKQINRLRKALRPGLPAFIDLEDFLVTRRYAQSKGQARKLMLDGKVQIGSHTVGRIEHYNPISGDEDDKSYTLQPFVPAKFRSEIVVLS